VPLELLRRRLSEDDDDDAEDSTDGRRIVPGGDEGVAEATAACGEAGPELAAVAMAAGVLTSEAGAFPVGTVTLGR
jgi:hypothetical protein